MNFCSSDEYLQSVQQQEARWKKLINYEREQKNRIKKMFEQLVRQHSELEEVAQHVLSGNSPPATKKNSQPNTSTSEDEEFFDAQESNLFAIGLIADSPEEILANIRNRLHSRGSDDGSSSEDDPGSTCGFTAVRSNSFRIESDVPDNKCTAVKDELISPEPVVELDPDKQKKKRRTRVPDKPNYPLNLWSIMKNCIGKELSKIPMPVNFSEPLSMLQRLTEDYEYAQILDKAAECSDYFEQMAYVAAFTISSYSTTACRTGKPFNPLLGETYECDRSDDLGWKSISEQVSHHPPIAAQFCEGRKWKCWQEFTMASKFRGKHLQIIPLGTSHLEFIDGNSYYTWRKVTTTVHNIIVGKLWVDQSGDMDIINHKQNIKCHLKYIPYSYFSRDSQRKVKGVVMNSEKEAKYVVQGTWDEQIEIAPVLSTSGTPDNPIYKTGACIMAWKRLLPPEDCEKYYNFTLLACQLNEPEEGVAPTDSRLRPDQRLMEEGCWDEANAEKVRLEEQQRMARKARELEIEQAVNEGSSVEGYQPTWFEKKKDPFLDNLCYVYKGEYWECKEKQDWSQCPRIF